MPLSPHTKLRGEGWSGVDGVGKAGKDMTCFSLTRCFWREPIGVAALAVGRRSSGKGGPGTVRTWCTEQGTRPV